MKMTLLLLWSLGNAWLLDADPTGQPGEILPISLAYQRAPNDPTPPLPPVAGVNAPPAYAPPANVPNENVSSGYAPAAQFNEFTSPCGDCNGGYGGDGGYGGGRHGRCRSCCKDSTCDMFQHYPYAPNNHGYYYFAPYNYAMVWQHQKWIISVGGDPRNPYTRAMFIPVYEQFENTMYDPDLKPSQSLIKKTSEGEIPTTVPTEPIPLEPTPPVPNPPEPVPGTSSLPDSNI
jgi:hypothetical protein